MSKRTLDGKEKIVGATAENPIYIISDEDAANIWLDVSPHGLLPLIVEFKAGAGSPRTRYYARVARSLEKKLKSPRIELLHRSVSTFSVKFENGARIWLAYGLEWRWVPTWESAKAANPSLTESDFIVEDFHHAVYIPN